MFRPLRDFVLVFNVLPVLPSGPRPEPNHPREANISSLRLSLCSPHVSAAVCSKNQRLLLSLPPSPDLTFPRAPVQTHASTHGQPFPGHPQTGDTQTPATVKSTDETQSKALMDGRSGSRGQGRSPSPPLLCLVCLTALSPWTYSSVPVRCGNPHRAPHNRTLVKVSLSSVAGVYLSSISLLPLPSSPPPTLHCAVMSSDPQRECDPLTL